MAYQGGGYVAPANFDDRKLSRLTAGTRKRRHHDRFRVRQLDRRRRKPPNADLSPREYCAHPSLQEINITPPLNLGDVAGSGTFLPRKRLRLTRLQSRSPVPPNQPRERML